MGLGNEARGLYSLRPFKGITLSKSTNRKTMTIREELYCILMLAVQLDDNATMCFEDKIEAGRIVKLSDSFEDKIETGRMDKLRDSFEDEVKIEARRTDKLTDSFEDEDKIEAVRTDKHTNSF